MLSRRNFLYGIGGAALALPILESVAQKRADEVPIRLVCVGNNFGFAPVLFFPQGQGKNYKSSPLLKSFDSHRNDISIFSKLDHPGMGGGHKGTHTFLTGIKSSDAKNMPEGNISIDQKAAQFVGTQTRYPSLQFSSGADSTARMSWSSAGVAIPPIQKLQHIYEVLFGKISPQVASKREYKIGVDTSILDLVKIDAKRLQKKISKSDTEKLDQYFTSVREVEKKLTMSKGWLHKPKPQVKYTIKAQADSLNLIDRLPLYYDLVILALQTDSTRIITLENSNLGANLGGFKISSGYPQLTHHGKIPEFLKELEIIEKFQTSQFSRFLSKMKEVKESNGKSLFDNTISLLGSGMGNASSHSNRNLPILLAGGGFKHVGHMAHPKEGSRGIPLCNLYLSMLQRFGMKTDSFNTATGTLQGLEA